MNEQYILDKLKNGIDEKEVFKQLYIVYYEALSYEERKQTYVKKIIDRHENLKEVIDKLNQSESALYISEFMNDLNEKLERVVYDYFDENEEHTINNLIVNNINEIKELLQSKKVAIDTVDASVLELNFPDVYIEYDQYKNNLVDKILIENPIQMYEKGLKLLKLDLLEKDILFTEEDFVKLYLDTFNNEKLINNLSKELTEKIEKGKKYKLTEENFDQMDENENEDYDSDDVLITIGDLDANDYKYVYQFIREYTGKRIYDSYAYWATYEEYFENLIKQFVFNHVLKVLDLLREENEDYYINFTERYKFTQDQLKDFVSIFEKCDRIRYEINWYIDKLWTEFLESDINKYYKDTKK